MAIFSPRANNGFISRINGLIKFQRLKRAFTNGEAIRAPIYPTMDFHSMGHQDASNIGMPKWNKIHGREFGISRSMIPSSPLTILKILQNKGFFHVPPLFLAYDFNTSSKSNWLKLIHVIFCNSILNLCLDWLSYIFYMQKLFSNLDNLVSCDRPSDCNIWVALLAFHMALVNNPQNSHIVLAFAATLYHGEWNEAENYAKENSLVQINFRPEIKRSAQFKSEELAKMVTHFALKVQGCIAALTSADCRLEAMPTSPY